MKKLIFCLLLIVISCSGGGSIKSGIKSDSKNIDINNICNSKDIKYGLINGKIVNGRKEPSIDSKVCYKFREGELVFYISKSEKEDTVNGDTDYWYNVENQDGETIWVFGKFIKILDPNIFDNCAFENIIKKDIEPRRWSEKNPETREKEDDYNEPQK